MDRPRTRFEYICGDVLELCLTCLQTQLPPDYIELEKRVDALKQVHQKMLQVTYVLIMTILRVLKF